MIIVNNPERIINWKNVDKFALYKEYAEEIRLYPEEFQGNHCRKGFVKVKDININHPNKFAQMRIMKGDLFYDKAGHEAFKQDLLDRGTFWPIFTYDTFYDIQTNTFGRKDGDIHISDGYHRLGAFLELIEEGKLPEDFKVFILCFDSRPDQHPILCDKYNRLVNGCKPFKHTGLNGMVGAKEFNEVGYAYDEIKSFAEQP